MKNSDTIYARIERPLFDKAMLVFLGALLLFVGVELNNPFFELIMSGKPLYGFLLACAMAIVEAFNTHLLGKKLVKSKTKPITYVLLFIGVVNIVMVYYGQREAINLNLAQPKIATLFDDLGFESSVIHENAHILATAVFSLIFIAGVSYNYIYFSNVAKHEPTQINRDLAREISSHKIQLEETDTALQRASDELLRIKPENKVNDQIKEFSESIENSERALKELRNQQEVNKQNHIATKELVLKAIERIYGDYSATNF